MESKYGRIDRLLSKHTGISLRALKPVLAAGRVQVAGEAVYRPDVRVGPFSEVVLDGKLVREAETPIYLMLNKPAGVVSATRDDRHRTVLDLLRETDFAEQADTLHLAGRLDATSTGLMLLTNDGVFSRALSQPDRQVAKRYLVDTEKAMEGGDVAAFAKGMYFATEDITTRPAELEILAPRRARVTLYEGRYHQIRRMFAQRDNRVTAIHRESIGPWSLPDNLSPGAVRIIDEQSVRDWLQDNCAPTTKES